jgi:hypothetical protein
VYLNGNVRPEIAGELEVTAPATAAHFFLGGRNDNVANFEGKLDEVAVYGRALTDEEVSAHYRVGVTH